MFAPRAPLTSTHVGTTARQPRKLGMLATRAPLAQTSLVGIVQLARTAGLGPADGGSSPSSDSADPVRPSKLGSNSFLCRDRWGGDEIPNLVLQSSILCRGANASLIQLEEGWAFTPEVLGSSPRGCTSQQVLAGQAVAVLQLAHNQSFGAGSTPAPATHQRI